MRIPARLSQLSQVTPDVVRALAEFHFDRRPDPLIPFLEKQLQVPLRHLNEGAFRRGDRFNCLALVEILYNLIAGSDFGKPGKDSEGLPEFPVFNAEVVERLQNKGNAMQAQAAWLSAHRTENPAGVLEAADLQDEYMTGGSQRGRTRPTPSGINKKEEFPTPNRQKPAETLVIDPEALFDAHLRPLLERYAVYATPAERAYAEKRLRAKLDRLVVDAVREKRGKAARFHSELRTLVNEQL